MSSGWFCLLKCVAPSRPSLLTTALSRRKDTGTHSGLVKEPRIALHSLQLIKCRELLDSSVKTGHDATPMFCSHLELKPASRFLQPLVNLDSRTSSSLLDGHAVPLSNAAPLAQTYVQRHCEVSFNASPSNAAKFNRFSQFVQKTIPSSQNSPPPSPGKSARIPR